MPAPIAVRLVMHMLDDEMVRSPSFVGAKVRGAIPLTGGYPVDALIQASLDPDVRLIEYVPTVQFREYLLRLDGVVITRIGAGRSLLYVAGPGYSRDLDEMGSTLIALESAGIGWTEIEMSRVLSEPARGDFRTVWGCRHVPVGEETLMAVSEDLDRRRAWSLGELASRIDAGSSIETIYSLACSDKLALDISNGPLSLDSIVTALPFAKTAYGTVIGAARSVP